MQEQHRRIALAIRFQVDIMNHTIRAIEQTVSQ